MTTATLPRTRPLPRLREFGASVATILVKELRSRFRGRRAFLIITVYLGVLALIAYGAYVSVAPDARLQGQTGIDRGGFAIGGANASAVIGQSIFTLLSVFQLLLVCFLAPAFTSGAISLEREKQTLDLILTTPMRPGGIVIGKLFSALAFVMLLILAGIPVSGLVLMYGGASISDILQQQVVLVASAIGFGVIGLFFSALVKRTQAATVLTYSTMLFLVIGTLLIFRFWTGAASNAPGNTFGTVHTAPEQVLYLNPAVAMIEIVASTEIGGGDYTDFMSEIRGYGSSPQTDDGFVVPLGGPAVENKGGVAIDCPPNARCARPPIPAVFEPAPLSGHYWPRFAVTIGALSLLLTIASMRLVVPMGPRWTFRRRAAVAPMAPAADVETDS